MLELTIEEIKRRAARDDDFRHDILATQEEREPIKAFCAVCGRYGYEVNAYELLTAGEQFCAAMLRSVNGGGVEAPDGWDDYYGMLMDELERMER